MKMSYRILLVAIALGGCSDPDNTNIKYSRAPDHLRYLHYLIRHELLEQAEAGMKPDVLNAFSNIKLNPKSVPQSQLHYPGDPSSLMVVNPKAADWIEKKPDKILIYYKKPISKGRFAVKRYIAITHEKELFLNSEPNF